MFIVYTLKNAVNKHDWKYRSYQICCLVPKYPRSSQNRPGDRDLPIMKKKDTWRHFSALLFGSGSSMGALDKRSQTAESKVSCPLGGPVCTKRNILKELCSAGAWKSRHGKANPRAQSQKQVQEVCSCLRNLCWFQKCSPQTPFLWH